jgi:hypothetical protein
MCSLVVNRQCETQCGKCLENRKNQFQISRDDEALKSLTTIQDFIQKLLFQVFLRGYHSFYHFVEKEEQVPARATQANI